MKKSALVILAHGFEDIEAITVIDILRRAEMEVTVAGTMSGAIVAAQGTHHLPDVEVGSLADTEFDCVVLPGGNIGVENLRDDPRVLSIIKNQLSSKRWLAAICAAPSILAFHHLLEGRKVVCHPGAQHLINKKNLNTQDRILVDGNLITSISPGSSIEFALEIVRQILGESISSKINAGVLAKL